MSAKKYELPKDKDLNAITTLQNAFFTPTEEKAGKKRRGRPQKNNVVHGVSTQEGLTAEYTRATFIVRVDLVEKLKNYAYTERLTMKEAINRILESFLDKEEKRLAKRGEVILQRPEGEGK